MFPCKVMESQKSIGHLKLCFKILLCIRRKWSLISTFHSSLFCFLLFCFQLKKVSDKMQWTAGCTKNCSAETFCKTSVSPPCLLECCNATSASCLWLNGTLNVPSSATRCPRSTAALVAFLLWLLPFTLLQWRTEVPSRVAPVHGSRSKALHNPLHHQ